MRVGGPADMVVEPRDVRELAALMELLRDEGVRWIVLGAGTNVLFSDSGYRGVVVRTSGLAGLKIEENGSDHAKITAAAGVPLPAIISRAAGAGWTGLEPLLGIPGSFGGGVAGNAGSGGVSIGGLLVSLKLLTRDGEEIELDPRALNFGYRSADLPAAAVVIQGTLRLGKGSPKLIETNLVDAKSRRRSTQPLQQPSAGCVFKNPVGAAPAGAIIDRLGFKGASVGGAQVSEMHANFIINKGDATAADILELMDMIRERVKKEEGVVLEPEIRIIDEVWAQ
jgi:UDP-N-acetylmuramate dehydrogenase